MTAIRWAIRTAFGRLGIVFLLGGPVIAIANDPSAVVVVLPPLIGLVAIVIAVMMSSRSEPPA